MRRPKVDLNKSLDTMKYDVRMLDWNKKQGTLKSEELTKHLESLPDSKANCEEVTLEDIEEYND